MWARARSAMAVSAGPPGADGVRELRALLHPTGELARIVLGKVRESDGFERLARAGVMLRLRHALKC